MCSDEDLGESVSVLPAKLIKTKAKRSEPFFPTPWNGIIEHLLLLLHRAVTATQLFSRLRPAWPSQQRGFFPSVVTSLETLTHQASPRERQLAKTLPAPGPGLALQPTSDSAAL